MPSSSKLFLISLVVCSLAPSMSIAEHLNRKSTLMARLKLNEKASSSSSSSCWDALSELQSYTGEIVLFFLNGETYLEPRCCRTIRTIARQCGPAMLGSLGFTSEEGDILIGYCDASESGDGSPPQPPTLPRSPPIPPPNS